MSGGGDGGGEEERGWWPLLTGGLPAGRVGSLLL